MSLKFFFNRFPLFCADAEEVISKKKAAGSIFNGNPRFVIEPFYSIIFALACYKTPVLSGTLIFKDGYDAICLFIKEYYRWQGTWAIIRNPHLLFLMIDYYNTKASIIKVNITSQLDTQLFSHHYHQFFSNKDT